MRATDDRYRGEQARFELAIRMIGHEARTGTIRYWTGLNDDRIRKLYTSYFKFAGKPVRRRRGRSPTQIAPLVSTPSRALESGVFANLLYANELLADGGSQPELRQNLSLGNRFCECFESHERLVPKPTMSFELAWNLLVSMRRGDELGLRRCTHCGVCYIVDLLGGPGANCPGCVVLADSAGPAQERSPACASLPSPIAPRRATH